MFFQKYKCEKCGKEFSYHMRFVNHRKTCEGALTVPHKKAFTCIKCGSSFKTRKTLNQHAKACATISYTCPSCAKRFQDKRGVAVHLKSCKNVDKCKNKSFKCRRCSEVFQSRRELYNHRVSQHGGADVANNVQNFQLVAPPWADAQGNVVDPALERVYNDNVLHIRAPHERGEVVQRYNFPTENLQGGVEEIMSHIEDIYREQNNSFKLNMNLGFIMRNRKTGEYRYYIPYANSYLFQTPHTITRHGSLRALKNKIKKINPQEYVRNQRPGSEWEPVYITNIHFDISLMDYVLGHSTQLPDHVKNSKSVLTFIACPKTGKVYNDQLCFFRCLAWHESQSQVGFESLTHRKYKEWVDYTPVALGKKCLGVTLHDIPEKLFSDEHYGVSTFGE